MDSTSTTPNSETDPTQDDQLETTPAVAESPEKTPAVEIDDKGYLGESPDKTPREHYTLAGVTAGKPTPENQR